MARKELEAAIEALKLSIDAVFIPYSRSRNAPKPHGRTEDERKGFLSLNWRITLQRDGRDILTHAYGAGSGHCPASRRKDLGKRDLRHAIAWECEHGHEARGPMISTSRGVEPAGRGKAIQPDVVDVIWAFSQDADAINYPTFEDWADAFGYDIDSRRAEGTYRECLTIALALRAHLGEAGIRQLQEAGQDY